PYNLERDNVEPETKIDLHFWSNLAKIGPLYGQKSLDFVQVESGYIVGAMGRELRQSASAWQLQPCQTTGNVESLLGSGESMISSMRLTLSQDEARPKDSSSVFVFQRSDEEYFWHRSAQSNELEASLFTDGEKGIYDLRSIFFHANAALLHSASLIIAIASPNGEIEAASLAQNLLEEASAAKLAFQIQLPKLPLCSQECH
ncbi:hypothetical protein, partial [Sporisorium scitamineum]